MLKIDRAFITAMNRVETKGQARFFKRLKCDEMQGYLYSSPLPFEQIRALLEAPPEIVIPPGPGSA